MMQTNTPDILKKIARLQDEGYTFERKFDGVATLASRGLMVSRTNDIIHHQFPEIDTNVLRPISAPWGTHHLGELVIMGNDGVEDFGAVVGRLNLGDPSEIARRAAARPAHLWLFGSGCEPKDLGRDLGYGHLGLEELDIGALGSSVSIVPSRTDGHAAWMDVVKWGWEGLVAKRPGSDNVKLKLTKSASFLAIGYEGGTGRLDGSLGAIRIGLFDKGKVVDMGKVGTGMTDDERLRLKRQLDAKKPTVVEVEFSSISNNKLRFPSYKGERLDVELTDANYTKQLSKEQA